MIEIGRTNQFKKDIRKVQRRKKNLEKLKQIIDFLSKDEELPSKYKDHKLTGNYTGRRECHIEPDWLLIYKKGENEIILERTGSHSDLFI